MKRKMAFTLIELLVVISIIALLLAIIMPALGKAKEAGRRVICQSNLKQMALAIEAYANEYDHWYPVINDGIDLDKPIYDSPPGWKGIDATLLLCNFVESPALFQCPSDRADFGSFGGDSYTDVLGQIHTGRNPGNYRTYGYNLNYYGWASGAQGVGGWRKSGEARIPSKTVYIVETPSITNLLYFGGYNVNTGPAPINMKSSKGKVSGYTHWPGYDIWAASRSQGFIHKKGCNYSFADGHAEYIIVDIDKEWPPFSWFDNGLYKFNTYPENPVWPK